MESMLDQFQNRQQAAAVLSQRLSEFSGTDAVIAVLSENAIATGCEVSRHLGLPLQFVACHEIYCPRANDGSIGSVAANTVVIHAAEHSLPQDFIYHQIRMGQVCSRHEEEKWNKFIPEHGLAGKTVIIISDMILSADALLAGVMEIRHQRPNRIVVATPVITRHALGDLRTEVDALVFLVLEDKAETATRWYHDLKELTGDQLIFLLHHVTDPCDRRTLQAVEA